MTPYDRLTAALPDTHDGPIGVIDSADLRAVLADAKSWAQLTEGFRDLKAGLSDLKAQFVNLSATPPEVQ